MEILLVVRRRTEVKRDKNRKEGSVPVCRTIPDAACVPKIGAGFPGGELNKSSKLTENKPPDLNFLPVHSSTYVEREREKLWRTYQGTFSSCNLSIYTGKPNYTRPQLPYGPWNSSYFSSVPEKKAVLSMFDKTYDAFKDLEFQQVKEILSIPDVKQSIDHISWKASSGMLAEFVQKLKINVAEVYSQERSKIKENVEEMMDKVFKILEQKYKIFKGYKLLKMGSTYEGTKLGKPDEFDFMIELPALCKILKFEEKDTSIDPELKDVKVLDRNIFADIYVPQDEQEDDTTFMINVWDKILELLCEELKENVLPGWRWLSTLVSSHFIGRLALTQQLMWSGKEFPSLIVDIDICLAVQQSHDNYETFVDFNQAVLDQRRPGISDGTKSYENESVYNHVILRSDGRARITMAVREMKIWRMEKAESRRVLYRCAKFMVTKYFPKSWNSDLYILDPVIPSYWLKTIMFYMFAHYAKREYWSDSKLPIRLVEVFCLLTQCIKTRTLSSYFVPHNIFKRTTTDHEKYSAIEQCLENVINNLCKLQMGNEDGFTNFDTIEEKLETDNEDALQKNLYKSVVELLYFYSYNEYSVENMSALQKFISVFLKDRVRIEGEGRTVKVFYDGRQMDINKELFEEYGETQLYFDS